MSLTYRPKNKIQPHCESQYDDGGWDANTSGCDLLGLLHQNFSLPVCDETGVLEGWHRVPYEMDEATSKDTALKLSTIPDTEIVKVLDKSYGRWGGTLIEFIQWVRDWQTFLMGCGGYKAD